MQPNYIVLAMSLKLANCGLTLSLDLRLKLAAL